MERRTTRDRAAAAATITLALFVAGCAANSEPDETASAATESPQSAELSSDLQQELQEVLEATASEYDVPGAVAGVWIPEAGSWTGAVGVGDIETNEPVTTEMSWPLRSVTKSFTVTLLLQLVDEGTVALDDTIDQYVDGVTNGDKITLEQLANMTSGVADYTNEAFVAEFSEDPDRQFTLDELNGFMLGLPAQFEPGARHVYTNANTNLLGAVIEKATGQPYADVLNERILEPLGLDDTHYFTDVADWTDPHSLGYGPDADPREPMSQNFSMFGPAGALVSTLEDAHVWAEALGSGALLEPETQALRQVGAPLEVGPPYGIYALGFGETEGWWGHNGEGLGYTAAVFHNPESGASIVVFANESNLEPRAHPADQTFRRLAEIVDAYTD